MFKVSKRTLLFIAAFVWTFAGGMLLFKGISLFLIYQEKLILRIVLGIIGGILFYFILFSKISIKHIDRISTSEKEKSFVFSFFDLQSYFLMLIMISMGILIRKSEIISLEYFSGFYITMGIPLLISAIRFYKFAFKFNQKLI